MKPIQRIGTRRFQKYRRKNAALQISVFASSLLIAFFLLFGGQMPAVLVDNPSLGNLPLEEYLGRWQSGMLTAAGGLMVLALFSVHLYGSIQREENQSLLAVLDSVGAVPGQKRILAWMETGTLFLTPMTVGFGVGGILGCGMFQNLRKLLGGRGGNLLPFVGILLGCLLLTLLDGMLPSFFRRRNSIIRRIRTRNPEAPEVRHGYRSSKVFRGYSPIKRLAKKSVDFHGKTYRRIAWAFALSLMIPILGLLLLWHLGVGEVVLDANPFDGNDTTMAVGGVVTVLFGFLSVGLACLTAAGLTAAIGLLCSQQYTRRETEPIYRAVGMTADEFARMLRYERRTAMAMAMVILLFLTVTASGIFAMIG